jgi:heptosyltransferase III
MRQAMRGIPAIDLTSQTNLRETMGVLANLSLFIGNDTGINHIAASLGVPTIGLFGATSAVKWGNVGPQNKVLTAPDGDLTRLEVGPVLELARHLLRTGVAVSLGAAR